MLPNGTEFTINEALYLYVSEKRLSIKDIRTNGSHFKTIKEKEVKYLCITSKCMTRSIR